MGNSVRCPSHGPVLKEGVDQVRQHGEPRVATVGSLVLIGTPAIDVTDTARASVAVGNDGIQGGLTGMDSLSGGSGIDPFVDSTTDDLGIGAALRDVITEFFAGIFIAHGKGLKNRSGPQQAAHFSIRFIRAIHQTPAELGKRLLYLAGGMMTIGPLEVCG